MDFEYLYPSVDSNVFVDAVNNFAAKMIFDVFPSELKRRIQVYPDSWKIYSRLIDEMKKPLRRDTSQIVILVTFHLLHDLFKYSTRRNGGEGNLQTNNCSEIDQVHHLRML